MIGLKFLMTFFTAAVYIAVGLFLALLFLFVVSYAIRFFVEGFRWGVTDHWKWFRGYLPKRKVKVKEWMILDEIGREIGLTETPDIWIDRGYKVVSKDKENDS